MIVCHCNVIGSDDIDDLVRRIAMRDPLRIITPGTVFAGCGKRPNCGGCMALVVATVAKARARCAEPPPARTVFSDPAGVTAIEVMREEASPQTATQQDLEAGASAGAVARRARR